MRRLLFAIAFAFRTSAAFAGAAPVSSQDASGTISVTATYQTLHAADANRQGCLIQNNGTHNMIVRFAGASVWTIMPGLAISCNNGAIVVSDRIEITGTAGDAFTAAFQ